MGYSNSVNSVYVLWGSAFPAAKKAMKFLIYRVMTWQENAVCRNKVYICRNNCAGGGIFIGKKIIIPEKKDLLPVMSLGIVQTTLQYIFFTLDYPMPRVPNHPLYLPAVLFIVGGYSAAYL